MASQPHRPRAADHDPLEAQTRITFFRSGGPGGQHRNKTSTAVRLEHLPTGVRVTAAEERSQHRNRLIAFERLRRKLLARGHRPPPRIPTRVTAASREARLRAKRLRATKKTRRQRPAGKGEEV